MSILDIIGNLQPIDLFAISCIHVFLVSYFYILINYCISKLREYKNKKGTKEGVSQWIDLAMGSSGTAMFDFGYLAQTANNIGSFVNQKVLERTEFLDRTHDLINKLKAFQIVIAIISYWLWELLKNIS